MRRGKRRRRRKTKSMTKAKKKQKGDDALTATKSEIQGNTVTGVPFREICVLKLTQRRRMWVKKEMGKPL